MFYILAKVEFDTGVNWIFLKDHYYYDGFELIKYTDSVEADGFLEYAHADGIAKKLSKADTHHWYSMAGYWEEANKSLTRMTPLFNIYSMGEIVDKEAPT